MSYEVNEPILNSPFEEPKEHWLIKEGETPRKLPGRRPSLVYPPQEGGFDWDLSDGVLKPFNDGNYKPGIEMVLVNTIRERVKAWRGIGYPGATSVTLDLLNHWRREGRKERLFFAQIEAAETIIFLKEARSDLLQGINIPSDQPSKERIEEGYSGFFRYGCKMATGSGKTTVMGMLAAWSIVNKVNNRRNPNYSDVILIICPNVTIRNRLNELDPRLGEASLYRTRDLVPSHMMSDLHKGRVLVYNWHHFEPRSIQSRGIGAKVDRRGIPVQYLEKITIGKKNDTSRGRRYLTMKTFELQKDMGLLEVRSEERDKTGNLVRAEVLV